MKDIEFVEGHYHFRFLSQFDKRARDFEDQKVRLMESTPYVAKDNEGITQNIPWPTLSFWQSYRYLNHCDHPYFVLQMSNHRAHRHFQIAVQVEVSKISYFQNGLVQRWIPPNIEEAQDDIKALLTHLLKLLRHHTSVMNLRLQLYTPGSERHLHLEQLLNSINFKQTLATTYVHTRFLDLRPSKQEILEQFTSNGRVRLKIKDKYSSTALIQEISDHSLAPHLQSALDDSYQRSVQRSCPFNFKPLFKSSQQFQDVMMLGFYLQEHPQAPKAFITGVHHSEVVEFSVGGSRSDEHLRKFPFNHILMWQLAMRAKEKGSQLLDMGGISIDNERLAGITQFKRSFPGFEIQVGSELKAVVKPLRSSAYSKLQSLKTTLDRWQGTH